MKTLSTKKANLIKNLENSTAQDFKIVCELKKQGNHKQADHIENIRINNLIKLKELKAK